MDCCVLDGLPTACAEALSNFVAAENKERLERAVTIRFGAGKREGVGGGLRVSVAFFFMLL